MEVFADRPAVGERRDQPVREVPGMRGDEAQPPDRGLTVGGAQRVDRADELGQVRATGQVELAAGPPFGIHVGEP